MSHKYSSLIFRLTFTLVLFLSQQNSVLGDDYLEDVETDESVIHEGCAGTGWIAFKDEKCFKLIQIFAAKSLAEELCHQQVIGNESEPGLVAPKYAAEQEFLTQCIFNVSSVESNVWIGASKVPNTNVTFDWDEDGSEFRYTNWGPGNPTGATGRDCVQMKSSVTRAAEDGRSGGGGGFLYFDPEVDGKWTDTACGVGNVVVCQKYQIWSAADVQRGILRNRRDIEELQELVGTLNLARRN